MADETSKLLLLFDRPREPSFMLKGNKTAFVIPKNLLHEKYLGAELPKFGEAIERVQVNDISRPKLDEILDLKRHENFSLFIPKHAEISGKLIRIFLAAKNVKELLSTAVYVRDRVNPYLFNYTLSVALLHREDTKHLDLPSFAHVFPEKFVNSQVFWRAREHLKIFPEGSRKPIEPPQTATDFDDEHRLAYWREDIGVNLHHWHWHLVYPFDGVRRIVDKDRRGELFYYMHHEIVARYNFERLCNNLKRVVRYTNFNHPIAEAYFPKLDTSMASRTWPHRGTNEIPRDIDREKDHLRINADIMNRWKDRIVNAIHTGSVMREDGKIIPLCEANGIDILGNIIESSILSINRNFYGDYHNKGHVMIGFIHDPDSRYFEPSGVMGDSAVAMRDPVFYRWHAHIDDIFQLYKSTLPGYTVEQLNYPEVTVNNIVVQNKGGPPNVLNTFWEQSDLDLSRGLDFEPHGPVFVRFTHLQNQEFTYTISVTVNKQLKNPKGTCRIFLAPWSDEIGDHQWSFKSLKDLFVEMDRFTVPLKQGRNTITRNSTESSVTIPFERTFENPNFDGPAAADAHERFNFCGCGWPQHMLLPKGTESGFPCHLFVMISSYDKDKVDQKLEGACTDGDSFCGIRDKKYPDSRAMGYPFDRFPREGVDTLEQFLTPNMRVQRVSIKFKGLATRINPSDKPRGDN